MVNHRMIRMVAAHRDKMDWNWAILVRSWLAWLCRRVSSLSVWRSFLVAVSLLDTVNLWLRRDMLVVLRATSRQR